MVDLSDRLSHTYCHVCDDPLGRGGDSPGYRGTVSTLPSIPPVPAPHSGPQC